MAKNMIRRPFPRGGIRTRLPVTIYRRSSDEFSPTEIEGLALWLDASSSDLYTTDAGPVVAVASPLDIAGCQLWLDASDPASITASSGEVTAWADKSATGSSWTRVGGANGPATGTQTMGGKNVVVFDGTNDGLSAVTPLNTSMPLTFFIVQRIVTATSFGMSYVAGTGTDDFNVRQSGTTGGLNIVAANNIVYNESAGPSRAGLNDIISWVVPSATSSSLFRGGSGFTLADATLKPLLGGTHYIGRRSDGFYLNGQIAEIIAFNTALTTADRARVEAYLAAKWGISGVHAPATATSDPVGYWADRSGNGRHAVQSLAGSRPLVGTLNSRRALTFDGTNDFLSADVATSSLCSTDGGVAFYIAVPNNASTWSAFSNAGSTTPGHLDRLADGTSYHGNFRASRFSGITPGAYSTTGAQLIVSRANASTGLQTIRKDGATIHSASENIAGYRALSGTATVNVATTVTSLGPPAVRGQFLNGSIPEIICYSSPLTDVQVRRIETYLAARWGITLAPQVANADAQNWIDRVYANGGTVSSATATAVNQFCVDIENAPGGSIRDRFFRLNLFCGSFQGAFVPLFRGPSLGGTQYGGATDTNVGGLFVPANYNETGASGGLAGNGSNKYLNTGFPTNTLSASDRHLAAYPITWPNGGYQYFLGSESAAGASQQQFALGHFDFADKGSFAFGPSAGAGYLTSTTAISSGGMWLGVNTSGSGTIYRNGVANGTLSLTAATPTASEIFAFAVNRASTPTAANYFNGRIGGYSIGLSMTAPQAAAYNTAMQAFQAALTRNV